MSNSNHPASRCFDFTGHLRQVCEDVVAHVDGLAHIDLARVAITFSQTRKRVLHGMWASTTPMRFENGSLTTVKRGREWTVQRLYDAHGQEMLYVVSFYMPRFMNLTLHDKLTTIVHELYHISPEFNGDLRRFSGRCYAHGNTQKDFDRQVDELTNQWLLKTVNHKIYDFLKLNFQQLRAQHGTIQGTVIKTPKLIPVPEGENRKEIA